jgi:hypothetical protein
MSVALRHNFSERQRRLQDYALDLALRRKKLNFKNTAKRNCHEARKGTDRRE